MRTTSKIRLGTELLENKCRVCGAMFSQKNSGRTREYCNDNCRNYFKYLSALDKAISNIDFKDISYVKSIKSDLFGLVNSLPKKIKEVK